MPGVTQCQKSGRARIGLCGVHLAFVTEQYCRVGVESTRTGRWSCLRTVAGAGASCCTRFYRRWELLYKPIETQHLASRQPHYRSATDDAAVALSLAPGYINSLYTLPRSAVTVAVLFSFRNIRLGILYLRQGGHVFISVCQSVCLLTGFLKIYRSKLNKTSWNVWT